MLQPPGEVLVDLLCHHALLYSPRWGDLAALGGSRVAVPLKGVRAGEEVATEIAEMDLLWVRLGGLTVPFEFFKVLEPGFWAKAALDRLDRPTREVGLRSLEE